MFVITAKELGSKFDDQLERLQQTTTVFNESKSELMFISLCM